MVNMEHPDLPGQPIQVHEQALNAYTSRGWVETPVVPKPVKPKAIKSPSAELAEVGKTTALTAGEKPAEVSTAAVPPADAQPATPVQ